MSDQYYCVKCKKKTEMRDPERVADSCQIYLSIVYYSYLF